MVNERPHGERTRVVPSWGRWRRVLTGACLLAAAGVAHAQLSGELSGSIGPGTFTVQDTIWILPYDTLVLQAGTTLQFTGTYPFQIWGILLAQGTAEDSVVFTADTLVSRWSGLEFWAQGSGSQMSYCVIEHSGTGYVWPEWNGAGIFCSNSSPALSHCTIQRNAAYWLGGGIYAETGSAPVLDGCVIRDNTANNGGGLYVSHAAPILKNCIISGNVVANRGGGVYANTYSGEMLHCTIAGNAAGPSWPEYGGGLYCDNSSFHMSGCIIAYSDGAAFYFRGSDSMTVEYCAVYGNTSGFEFWSDDPEEGPEDIGEPVAVNANGDSADAYLNILLGPQFVDTSAADYHLTNTSPCIGAADSTTGVHDDFDGSARPNPAGSRPDIGAFESALSSPYVPEGLAGELSGTLGPGHLYVTDSILVAIGDTLEILPGTVLEFWGPYPFTVYGTLLAAGSPEDSIRFTTNTEVNAARWRGIEFNGLGSSSSRMTYCIVENGYATGPDIPSKHGGAVYCNQSQAKFAHCTFRSNVATWGGALSVSYYFVEFEACVFEDNLATDYGGGVYDWGSLAVFTNCVFLRNTALYGGGAACSQGTPDFLHCTFSHNSASGQGGGIYCSNSLVDISSSIIAFSSGAGAYFAFSQGADVRYCDFHGNSGGATGSAGDTAGHGPVGIGEASALNANGDSCDLYFNIFSDPAFADTLSGDLHLTDSSRCIGAAEIGVGPSTDFEGDPRPNPPGSRPDIGAFESPVAPPLPEGLAGNLAGEIGPGVFAVVDTIAVEVDDTLRLWPGTTFEFHGPFPFLLRGTLLAEGTAEDSIVFTADPLVNPALWRGLRFDSTSGSSRLMYCTLERGMATDTGDFAFGGNVYCRHSSPMFEHCTFRHGTAGYGGGLAGWYASPIVQACSFHDNSATQYGGGLYLWYSDGEIENTLVYRNASTFGGGMVLSGGTPTVDHCTVMGNVSSGSGGGVRIASGSAVLRNSIVAFSAGSGLDVSYSPSAQIAYCDLFGNSDGDISVPDDTTEHAPPGLGLLDSVNANGDSCDGYRNLFLNPMLADTGNADCRLTQWSPCIGAGLSGDVTEDFAGDPRPSPPGSSPDIGAFEHERDIPLPPAGLIGYLSGEVGPGVLDVLGSIYVQAGRTLRIRPGTTLAFLGPYRFQIEGTLLAEGSETDSIRFTTDTVSNPDRWRGLRLVGAASSSSILRYCVIEHGRADGGAIEDKRGGGVYCEYSSPAISHCVIRGCSGEWGGGLACWYASPAVSNCWFGDDIGSDYGGGIYAWESNVSLSQCLVVHCSGGNGGGMSLSGGTPVIQQCTMYGNSTAYDGGGLYFSSSAPVVNSTIIARSSGAGIYFWNSSNAAVSFSDFFGNSAGDFVYSGDDPAHGPDSLALLARTNANGDSCDTYSNIYLDPHFADTLTGDFGLSELSPCVDAGDPTLPHDVDGTAADIGALGYDHGYRAPDAFGLASPQWGDTCWTLDTVMAWQTATDSEPLDTVRYDVWLDTAATMSGAWVIALNVRDTSCAATGLLDDREYYWTVVAKDRRGLTTPANDTMMFRTYEPEPPGDFSLAEPADQDTVFSLTPTLRWRKAEDPDPGDSVCYRVTWSYREDFAVVEDTLVCDTSVTLSEGTLHFRLPQQRKAPLKEKTIKRAPRVLDDVEDDSTVYWKVDAIDRFGLVVACEPPSGWRFTVYVEQPPDSFDLLEPSDQDTLDTLNVAFRWNEAHEPDAGDSIAYYRLYLSSDPDFLIEVDSLTTADTQATLSVDDDEDYWWYVRAFDTHGNSTPSRHTRRFHTYREEPPLPFALAAPDDGDTLSTTTPVLRWQASLDPDPGDSVCYRLYWSYDEDFALTEDTALCDTFFVFPQGMLCARPGVRAAHRRMLPGQSLDEIPDDSTVYWKVESYDRTGRSAQCVPPGGWHFTVYIPQNPLGFDLLSPASGTVVDTSAVELIWQAAVDPDPGDSIAYYRVYAAHDSLFTVEPDSEDVVQTHCLRTGLEDDATYWWRVRAFDTQGLSALSSQRWNFHTYICEAPAPFDLMTPPDSFEVEGETDYCWRACLDPDPNDTVTYTLHFQSGDSLLEYLAGRDTCLPVNLTETTLAGALIVEWWVSAHSVCPDTVTLSTSRFRVLLPSSVAERGGAVPQRITLCQNYPNPFNPNTEIRFDLPEAVRVELKVFNILGQEVVTLLEEVRPAGAYRVMWDGKSASGISVASGVFVYQLKTGKFTDAKKMVLIR